MTRRPTQPGNIIREDYLVPLSITIKDMAQTLGVSRKTFSKILNERGAVTPDMALRLSRALDTSADFWLNLQKNFDLWQAETASRAWQKVKPLPHQVLHPESSPNSEQSM
jgi:addiction module HigA family antidote